jgi:iron complex transport system permease protein
MKKVNTLFISGILLSVAIILICTFFGSADISFRETVNIIGKQICSAFGMIRWLILGTKSNYYLEGTIPSYLLAFFVGGILAICGAVYQAIFRNPMADPFMLGISSGAAFGATFGILFAIPVTFIGLNAISIMAFISAVITIFFVYNIAKVGRHAQLTSLLLTGIAVNQFLTAIISFAMLFSHNQMKEIYYWTLGSFSGKGWDQFWIVLPYALIGYILVFIYSRDLDIIMLGDESAIRFGVETEKVNIPIIFY